MSSPPANPRAGAERRRNARVGPGKHQYPVRRITTGPAESHLDNVRADASGQFFASPVPLGQSYVVRASHRLRECGERAGASRRCEHVSKDYPAVLPTKTATVRWTPRVVPARTSLCNSVLATVTRGQVMKMVR